MPVCNHVGWRGLTLGLSLLALCSPAQAQIGPMFSGAGAANLSMGGAAVATANDATGAIYWNPATLSGLERSEMNFGAGLLYPQERVISSVARAGLAGSDRSDSGVYPIPSASLAYRPDGSPWTFGLGIFPVAGFGVNYPASLSNPVLTPQRPAGIGFGSIFSDLQVLQISPVASYQVNERLSIGGGPILALADLQLDPAVIAPPDAALGAPRFPGGTHTRFAWGGGFQGGVYLTLDGGWRLGASLQSPRWFERFQFRSSDSVGRPLAYSFGADLPLIASIGTAYAGFERWLLAADVRYVDFEGTRGLGDRGFDPRGALRGAGFRSVVALALGAQYQATEYVSLRAGYTYNQNPISSSQAFVNVAAPTILEHLGYVGASYAVTDSFILSLAYQHGFQNSVTGPFVTPAGAVPGTSLKSVVSADYVVLGATVRFGGCRESGKGEE